MATAMERVISIPELLELVLEASDTWTLLTSATRVCRSWKILIQDSPRLQRALFLLPEKHPSCLQPRANPLLSPYVLCPRTSKDHSNSVNFRTLLDVFLDDHLGYDSLRKSLRCKASWQHMLLQQPPAMKVGLWWIGFSSRGVEHHFDVMDMSYTKGLTLPDFLHVFKRWEQMGYSWTLFWGENWQNLLEMEKDSLLVLKAESSVQTELLEMRDASDVVFKLISWSER